MPGWRVFWVPTKTFVGARQISVLTGWDDLHSREERTGVHPGDPIMLSPDYRVDELLSEYLSRSSFVLLEHETKRNYTSDYRVFFDFLWGRGKLWTQATADDLLDFHDWRVRSPQNPDRVGGAKWNRELAALTRLYDWADRRRYVPASPVQLRTIAGRYGGTTSVPAGREKSARTSNVHWLTPRAFRRWLDLGMRGHTAQGWPDATWASRLEARNVAYAELLFSSGMRLVEGASLLTVEVPRIALDGGRY